MSTPTISKTMRALVQLTATEIGVVERPTPKPLPGEVLVKVEYAAQNPVDYQLSTPSTIIGFDLSSHLLSPSPRFPPNTPLCGMVHGGKSPRTGAFAEYAVLDEELCWKRPEGWTGAEGATGGVGVATAGQCLFYNLGLPFPGEGKVKGSPWILIYSAATSIGLYAIQLARASGCRVVATASEKNFELLKGLGVDGVVDYHDADKAIDQIQSITGNTLTRAMDCISNEASQKFCLSCFGSDGGKLVTVNPIDASLVAAAEEKKVEVVMNMAFILFGKTFTLYPGMDIPADLKAREFYVKLCKSITNIIETYGIKPNPVKLMEGGLDGVAAGFELQKAGKVSGEKLVYKI